MCQNIQVASAYGTREATVGLVLAVFGFESCFHIPGETFAFGLAVGVIEEDVGLGAFAAAVYMDEDGPAVLEFLAILPVEGVDFIATLLKALYLVQRDGRAHADKFPGLCTPDESYHGLTYTKAFGKGAYMTKATAQLMRDLGSIQSPQNAFLLNLGLETLHLRMPQHCGNAQKVAEYLAQNDKVAWVNYCGLPGNKYYELAQKYMPNGSCGVISFGLKGGRELSIKFMDSLKLAAIVTHVADARTCVLHPASHTHRQLTDEQLIEAGVRPDLIRLSVGIENADDIIADIEQALNA